MTQAKEILKCPDCDKKMKLVFRYSKNGKVGPSWVCPDYPAKNPKEFPPVICPKCGKKATSCAELKVKFRLYPCLHTMTSNDLRAYDKLKLTEKELKSIAPPEFKEETIDSDVDNYVYTEKDKSKIAPSKSDAQSLLPQRTDVIRCQCGSLVKNGEICCGMEHHSSEINPMPEWLKEFGRYNVSDDPHTMLVTGGSGFIGSHFIRYMLEKYPEYKIVNIDKLSYAGSLKNNKDYFGNSNYRFHKGDIANMKFMESMYKIYAYDIVVNFAAESHVDRSIDSSMEFINTNIIGVHNILEICRKNPEIRFCQISSDEVYGPIETGSFNENDILNPGNPYSASKASADMMCIAYHNTYDVNVSMTRSVNNFGTHQYPEKLIPLFITRLKNDEKVPVYGEGKQIRSWIHVLDNCSAIDFIVHKGESGEIYNIDANPEGPESDSIQISNIDMTKLIIKIMGKDESYIEYVEDRKGHDFRYSVTAHKLIEMGWKPKHLDFEEELREVIDKY